MVARILPHAIRAAMVWLSCVAMPAMAAAADVRVPILLYHRFGPAVSDTMTVTTPVFEAQLRLLQQRDYQVIPLRRLVEFLRGGSASIPERAVVIVADDGHGSVFSDMFPLVRRYRIPATLFVYPSAISNAGYALTWQQLTDMKASGQIDVQSHTYWHPNFTVERRRLVPDAYRRFVHDQLVNSRTAIERRLGGPVDLLAWPFGIYDEDLMRQAAASGYVAAFSIERRPATRGDNLFALPRYIVTDADRGARFEALLAAPGRPSAPPTLPTK